MLQNLLKILLYTRSLIPNLMIPNFRGISAHQVSRLGRERLANANYMTPASTSSMMSTRVLKIDPAHISLNTYNASGSNVPINLDVQLDEHPDVADSLAQAAKQLRYSVNPVAFPTETVYGLGADATRSDAVRAVFSTKGRPADNPLIVHIASLTQLASLFKSPTARRESSESAGDTETLDAAQDDPFNIIPQSYHELIRRFWPGPLTILLPVPKSQECLLSPLVTAGLSTVGVRMPSSKIALALLKLADVPVAAPSANASTKPSPTAAEHVLEDLEGKIETIVDGGMCEVGIESTVVDGMREGRPVVLRPGGVSLEELRQCDGWENVEIAQKNPSKDANGVADDQDAPRAPGMKYRHYAPKATVVLFEHGKIPDLSELWHLTAEQGRFGVIRTASWPDPPLWVEDRNGANSGFSVQRLSGVETPLSVDSTVPNKAISEQATPNGYETSSKPFVIQEYGLSAADNQDDRVWLDLYLGPTAQNTAKGIFFSLRELDSRGVSTIFIEGLSEERGDLAVAVMNRIRKAADEG